MTYRNLLAEIIEFCAFEESINPNRWHLGFSHPNFDLADLTSFIRDYEITSVEDFLNRTSEFREFHDSVGGAV